MLSEKWVYALICLAVITSVGKMFGGTSPSCRVTRGGLLATVHELDLLVEEGLPGISTPECLIETSPRGGYCGRSLLDSHIFLGFSTKKWTEQKDAATDFADVSEKILRFYNNIPALRPYLKTFPVTSTQLCFYMQYGPVAHASYKPPYYGFIERCGGSQEIGLVKWTNPKASVFCNPQTIVPFDQVPTLVKMETVSVLRKKVGNIQPIFVDKFLKRKRMDRIDVLTYPIMCKLCATYDIHMSTFRACRLFLKHHVDVDFGFWTQGKELPLAQAKEFTYTFIEDALDQVRTQKVVEKDRKNSEGRYVDATTTLDWFCFQISFWDKWLNRVDAPYIAQIDCNQGMIYYYAADEGQRLYKVLEEPAPDRFFLSGKNPKSHQ